MLRPAVAALLGTAALFLIAPCGAQSPCPLTWDPAFGNPGTAGSLYGLVTQGVFALRSFTDAAGPAVYAGGNFTSIGGVPASGVARFDGTAWAPLGSGTDGPVLALAIYDDGSGPALYAGGAFNFAGGVTSLSIARWTGAAWAAVGGGVNGSVSSLLVHDDGSGPKLYVAGGFNVAGTVPANRIAAWDGAAWTPLGAGPGIQASVQGPIFISSMAIHDDGAGPRIYAGGPYNGLGIGGVSRFDGAAWIPVGAPPGPFVPLSLASHDDGLGSRLYAGLQSASGSPPTPFARWNGNAWSGLPLATGISAVFSGVRDFAIADNGCGPGLYAAFNGFGQPRILSWAGTQWVSESAASGGATILAIEPADDTGVPHLFAGGSFTSLGGVTATGVARARLLRPAVLLGQPNGQGGATFVWNDRMVPGRIYQNVFSFEPCPGPLGGGPWLGLCTSDPAFFFLQISAPLGAVPFHFRAQAFWSVAGPFTPPSGLVIDALCFDRTGEVLGAIGPVSRYTIQ